MGNFVIFVGAGASRAFGVPTMTEMTQKLEEKLREKDSPQLHLFHEIKSLLQGYQRFDIEALITVLQDVIEMEIKPPNVLNHPSVYYFASLATEFDNVLKIGREHAAREKKNASELLKEVKSFIMDCCSINDQSFDAYDELFIQVMYKHGSNVRETLKKTPMNQLRRISSGCSIFTTNYDKVLEAYCNHRYLEYECGETSQQLLRIGADNSRLYSAEPLFQIYKLHGSVNWYADQNNVLHWLTEPAQTGRTTSLGDRIASELLIYPVNEKYTFREPFYAMFHHLKERLVNREACKACYVIGYSFRDEDILGIFRDAMIMNPDLHVTLIDPQAANIVKERFSAFSERIRTLEMEFCVAAVKNLA